MNMVTSICLVLLAIASAFTAFRLVVGPSLSDRVVAADLQLTLVVMASGVAAVRTGSSTFLRIMLVVSVVGFIGTTMAAKFIEERGT